LTAFRPIPARQAAELIEAAGIPDARRLLIDSAAADLVKAYALVMETIEQRGAPKVDRGNTIPVHVMQRVVSQGVADDLWSGGTVRLPGSDLVGGAPEVNLTTVGFSEKHLRRLIDHHSGVPAAATRPAPDQQARSMRSQDEVPADAQVPAPLPAPVRAQRWADLSAIPPGALTITMKQAMAATGLGRTTVDKLCNAGKLTRVKVGGRALVTTESIQKLLDVPTA
jgi:hypothetical protein